jgi:hypothetical protein
MFKSFLKAMALCAAFIGGAAHASTFDFSYTFADGLALTGSLSGTLNGALVNGISNVDVTFNGTAFNGPLYIGSFNAASSTYNYSSGAAVVSTNASLNNFIIADSNDPQGNGATNYFYFVNGATPSGVGTQEVLAVNGNVLTNNTDLANPALGYAAGTWTLTPVPIPAALPLMASGLGLIATKRRRRIQGALAHA